MRYRVKWYLDVPKATFPQFGKAFMEFLQDQSWEFTGTLDVTAGTALLDGFFITDVSYGNDFRAAVSDFAAGHGWSLKGTHNWDFYREVD